MMAKERIDNYVHWHDFDKLGTAIHMHFTESMEEAKSKYKNAGSQLSHPVNYTLCSLKH